MQTLLCYAFAKQGCAKLHPAIAMLHGELLYLRMAATYVTSPCHTIAVSHPAQRCRCLDMRCSGPLCRRHTEPDCTMPMLYDTLPRHCVARRCCTKPLHCVARRDSALPLPLPSPLMLMLCLRGRNRQTSPPVWQEGMPPTELWQNCAAAKKSDGETAT